MKVSSVLVFAVMAFQANALFNTQKTSQEVEQKGGKGGNSGDTKQDGGNGGDAAKSTGGKGGDSGDASGGEGSNVKFQADHNTQGGDGAKSRISQETSCYGSCVTVAPQTSAPGGGGAAGDASQVKLEDVGRTDSSGGSSTGGNGGHSQAEGDGGSGSQHSESEGGKGGDGNKGGSTQGGSTKDESSTNFDISGLPGPLGALGKLSKLGMVRRYQPGAYDERNAGIERL